MTPVSILERQDSTPSDMLDPWFAREVEALLEKTDDSLEDENDDGQVTQEGRWYFRMPQPGVRYYSF